MLVSVCWVGGFESEVQTNNSRGIHVCQRVFSISKQCDFIICDVLLERLSVRLAEGSYLLNLFYIFVLRKRFFWALASCTLAQDGKLYVFDGDSLLPLVPPQKNQCSFRVYNLLIDISMEPAIVSRTMCTQLQRAEQQVACRFLLPTSTATKHRSRISVASFLSVLPRNLPSCAGSRMVSMF